METLENPARARLEAGEMCLGVGVRLSRTMDIVPIMKAAGFDWLFLDLEHGTLPLDITAQMSVTAIEAGITPLVRVPKGQYSLATRALDNGAGGIVMPHVDSAAEAREIVQALKYPPMGHRSNGGAPQFRYRPVGRAESMAILNASSLVVVMIESPEAVEQADAIAAVEGVDVLLFGTNDLCAEMGIPGKFDDPKVVSAYETVLAACKKHKKWPGMGGIYDDKIAPRYIKMGYRFVLSGSDLPLLLDAATTRAKFLRSVG